MKLPIWITGILQRPFWVVLGGAGFAQVLGLLVSPLLSRLYTPEAFGLLTIFSSMLGLFSVFMGGRYEYAIIGESDDRTADLLVFLVILISGLVCLLSGGAYYFFDFSNSEYQTVMPALLFSSVAYVVGVACNNWLIRRGMFPIATGLKIVRVFLTFLLSVCFFSLITGLVWGAAGSYLLLAVAALYACRGRGWPIPEYPWCEIVSAARKHFKFPIQSAVPAVFDNLALLIPVYWASSLFGAEDVGQWGLSRMALSMPLAMIASSMAQVLMKRLHDLVRDRVAINGLLFGDMLRIAIPTLILCLLISLAGAEIFSLIFGQQWRRAGEISIFLVWAYGLSAICSVLSVVFVVLRKLVLNGLWQVAHCLGVYVVFANWGSADFDRFIRLFVCVEILFHALFVVLLWIVCRTYKNELDRISITI